MKSEKYRSISAAWLVMLGIVGSTLLAPAATTQAAGMLVADGGFGGVLEIASHEVQVTINNGIAVTEVTQEFRNTEDRIVEALYTFPVPKGASVANFSMWINGKEMVGEVLEKKRAREIYESYKETRRDPGLLEQTDYKTFEMRIFPIAAKATQKVRIRYYQEFESDHDWVNYVYPLSTVTHNKGGSRTTGKFAFSLHAKSRIPIVEMQSPSHKDAFVFAEHGENYYQASLETQGGDMNRDVVLAYRMERPVSGIDMAYHKAGMEDGYFCLTLTAGKELAGKTPPMDYVFLLDISGSMADESKLSISRKCIGEFVSQLSPEDRFELMTFNVTPNPLFKKLQQADENGKKAALEFLASRKAVGGTVLLPALQTAYKYRSPDRPLNVVLLSDGMTQQSERRNLLMAIKQRPSNVKVFCVGVGNEINRDLLRNLAEDAGGLAAFLSQGDNFKRQASAFRRKLISPVMRNLKIAIDGVGVYDIEPEKLPNLFHGTPIRMYGRYRKAADAKVTITGEISGTDFSNSHVLSFPANETTNPEIQRMWAWHKVQRLMREIDKNGKNDRIIDEIVRLGEGYSISTQYTSFIVLENDQEYKRWKIKRRNNLLVERDRKAHKKLLTELQSMRDKSMAKLGPDGDETTDEAIASAKAVRPKNNGRNRGFPVATPTRKHWGGGPVGPIGLAVIGALVAAQLRRRKKDRTC